MIEVSQSQASFNGEAEKQGKTGQKTTRNELSELQLS